VKLPAFQQSETLISDIWRATSLLYGWLFRHWRTHMAPKLRPALLRMLEQHRLDALEKRQEAAAAGANPISQRENPEGGGAAMQ
jgi:hypothetical protein